MSLSLYSRQSLCFAIPLCHWMGGEMCKYSHGGFRQDQSKDNIIYVELLQFDGTERMDYDNCTGEAYYGQVCIWCFVWFFTTTVLYCLPVDPKLSITYMRDRVNLLSSRRSWRSNTISVTFEPSRRKPYFYWNPRWPIWFKKSEPLHSLVRG